MIPRDKARIIKAGKADFITDHFSLDHLMALTTNKMIVIKITGIVTSSRRPFRKSFSITYL